jgi:hypothetical protein
MIHLREHISTQLTGRTAVTHLSCADIVLTWMAKRVIVAKARPMAEDAP